MRFSYSLILCCYNSEKVIRPTVRSLCNLSCDNTDKIELIVVDNNCQDSTVDSIYDEWDSEVIALKVVSEENPGLMNARIRGVSEASNEIVVFIDDDNILLDDWLKNVDNVFDSHDNVACVGGKVVPAPGEGYPYWFDSFQGVYACGEQAPESMVVSKTRMTLFGAGLAFRYFVINEILTSSDLYLTGRTKNRLLRGDDSEICMRCIMMGYDTYYSNDLLLVHNLLPERVTWEYVKKARFGGGMAEIVLSMYRKINSGFEPNTYLETMLLIVRRWLSFFSRFENIFRAYKEGTKESFELQYLKGLSYGLLSYSPRSYNLVKDELLRLNSHYKGRELDV